MKCFHTTRSKELESSEDQKDQRRLIYSETLYLARFSEINTLQSQLSWNFFA